MNINSATTNRCNFSLHNSNCGREKVVNEGKSAACEDGISAVQMLSYKHTESQKNFARKNIANKNKSSSFKNCRIYKDCKLTAASEKIQKFSVDLRLSNLFREFNDFTKLKTAGARIPWLNVKKVLIHEKDAPYLEQKGEKGCHHIYFAAALFFFLNKQRGLKWQELNQNIKPVIFEIFTKALEDIYDLIHSYLHISANLETKKNKLKYSQLKKRKKILFPLGWRFPNSLGGHLILCQLSEKTSAMKVDFFNPVESKSSRCLMQMKFGDRIYKKLEISSSLSILERNSKIDLLNRVKSLLQLHDPSFCKERFRIPNKNKLSDNNKKIVRQKLIDEATKVIYSKIGKNCEVLQWQKESPLSTIKIFEGNNCVPNAFRMFIYNTIEQHARDKKIDFSKNGDDLKRLTKTLFTQFKYFVISQLTIKK